jgi:hypothetical protein
MGRIASLIFGALALLFLAAPAQAQSGCVYIVPGAVLTAGQWNFCLSSKIDYQGYTPLNPANLVGISPITITPSAGIVQVACPTCTTGGSSSFAAAAPLAVTFPSGVVTYALNFNSTLILDGSNKLGMNTPVGVGNGGTGLGAYTTGQILYASAATTIAGLSDVATGQLLGSGGVGAAPAYCAACTLTTSLTVPLVTAPAASNLALNTPSANINFQVGGITYVVFGVNLLEPNNDSGVTLGASNFRWSTVWAAEMLVYIPTGNPAGTSTDGFVGNNATPAAAGAQQFSPRLRLTGQGWKTNATAASQNTDWIVENQPVQGAANPSSNLVFSSQINAGGYNVEATLTSGGVWNVATGFQIGGANAAVTTFLVGNGTNFVAGTMSGDATLNSGAVTLATVNSNVGTFGSTNQVGQFTVNAKGLVTAASNVTINPTQVNGVTFSAAPISTNTVCVATSTTACTWESVPNAALANSSVTIGSTNVALGATAATVAGLTLSSPTITGTLTMPDSSTDTSVGFNLLYLKDGASASLALASSSSITTTKTLTFNTNNQSITLAFGASFTTTGAGAPTLAFPASSFTYTFQGSSDTILGRATTDTLTNKTLASTTDVLGGVTMTLGSDATGDLYYRNSSGVLTRLAVCTGTNVLGASGGLPACVAQSGGTITAGSTATSGISSGNIISSTSNLVADSGVAVSNVALLNGSTFTGAVVLSGTSISASGNISAAAWTTAGVRYANVAGTLTDTSSSGTVAAAYTDVFGGNTIAASSATTFTNYTSLYVKNPIAGTNVTLTAKFALGADSLSIVGGTLANAANVFNLTATQPASPVAAQTAVLLAVTGAGSASQANTAFRVNYLAGYTGSSLSIAAFFQNTNAGTASTLIPAAGSNTIAGNVAQQSNTAATTTGLNIGTNGIASGGNINIGLAGIAQAAKASALNVGVLGSAINTGATSAQIGGYFTLNGAAPSSSTASAAIVADNGSQSSAIANFLAAGVIVASVNSTGGLTATLTNVATTSAVCYNTGTGLISYDGTLGTCTVSDGRLKNVDGPIMGALDRLLQIRGVYFHWKDQQQFGIGEQVGIIAQDVQKVFPQLVSTDSEGKLSADYQRLVAPIIEALREVKADNDNLRSEMRRIAR